MCSDKIFKNIVSSRSNLMKPSYVFPLFNNVRKFQTGSIPSMARIDLAFNDQDDWRRRIWMQSTNHVARPRQLPHAAGVLHPAATERSVAGAVPERMAFERARPREFQRRIG
jgi:hypothetical protein